MKIAICGGPRTGKSTHALELNKSLALPVRATDDLMHQQWDTVSDVIAGWFDEPDSMIIEGVRAIHGLRKWLTSHPTGKPCDKLIWMSHPKTELTKGQLSMHRGCNTIFIEQGIQGILLLRGVELEFL